MATYRNPTYKPLEAAGTMPVKQAHKQPVSVAHQRSEEYAAAKTSGVKTRGNGAAVRGVTARGPMC